jgi:hypothetical protein
MSAIEAKRMPSGNIMVNSHNGMETLPNFRRLQDAVMAFMKSNTVATDLEVKITVGGAS